MSVTAASLALSVLLNGAAVQDEASVFVKYREGIHLQVNDKRTWDLYERVPRYLDYDNSKLDVTSNAVAEILYELVPIQITQRNVWVLSQTLELGSHQIVLKSGERSFRFEVILTRKTGYLGHLEELIGVPFVYYPKFVSGRHQSDARLGADCVALVVYGRRRLGEKIPYMSPSALDGFTTPVKDAREGDILHFGYQTAVLYEDLAPVGTINASDLVIHSYHDRVRIQALRELPYKSSPYVLRRWN